MKFFLLRNWTRNSNKLWFGMGHGLIEVVVLFARIEARY